MTDCRLPTPGTRHPAPDYIELRARSAFSFLSGASLPEDLIERSAALGYSAIALGDRDGVYGAPRFHQAAKKAGVRALVGCEISLVQGVGGLGGYGVRGRKNESLINTLTPNTLYFLAANRTGYQNLCRLLTDTKLRAKKGESFATWADLDGHTEGLICLLGQGPLTPNPLTPNPLTPNILTAVLTRLRGLFGSRLYIDIQRHLDADEERLNRVLIDIAQRYRIPLVATNDVRHATRAARPLLDVLTCIQQKTNLDAAGRLLLRNAERHLKSPRAMAALFSDLPEAVANTRRIAEECEFTLADLGYRFPDYPLPPGETPNSHLRELTYRGAMDRYGTVAPKVRRQLEHELAVIAKLELAGYFLIVWDIVRFCREQGILAQGRGSAANSAVCYSLGITAVDAVGMELLFERFLSEERGEWPDIDIDLPSGDQREKVIQYVYQRYGERGAAMTANVITYRTRSAVREVGKALGFSLEQVDKLSKLLRRFEFRDDMDELNVQLEEGGVDPGATRVKLLTNLVQQIQNLPRHLGQHSGGMVIAAGRLDHVVPLEPASMPGRVVVQWDKDDCADLGIIKVDLLGLGMMAVLEEAIPLIRAHEGVDVDLAHLPPDDPKTYDMLRKADTVGVFQVESRAQMATLPRMKPERFYDLVVEVAIIRPGPIVGQMVHPYLNRRNGREAVTYAHPDLEPILKRTLGVPLFQEQLLRMAMVLADFTGGEAEELRRAMGFKRSVERMAQIDKRLRDGMAKRGIRGKTQDDIVRSITSFALYGFPESHAASFALLAYASAYLRAHHLAAFTCAMLNNWPMGFYHPATLVKDAQRHGLRVLPVDVMRSGWLCRLERGVKGVRGLGGYGVRELLTPTPHSPNPLSLSLRLGLRFVTGLREQAGKRIEEEAAKMPFVSIADVIHRADLRDNEAAALAYLGAFSSFGRARRESLWQAAAVPREPLFKGLRGYGDKGLEEKDCGNNTKQVSRKNGRERISGAVGMAASDATGEGMLSTDERVPPGRIVRPDDAASSGRRVSAGEHRRGQWQENEEGLRQLSTNCAGQSARSRDLFDSGVGSSVDPRREDLTTARASKLRSEAVESSDPSLGGRSQTPNPQPPNPLPEMSALDRTLADYRASGITVGPHIVKHLRPELEQRGVLRSTDLKRARNGQWTKIAGLVIVRQRPGTAKGMCFITLEDETGTSNAAVMPQVFRQYRSLIHTAALMQIEGPLQKVDDVIHVLARRIQELKLPHQTITQSGNGYRMRVTPEAANDSGVPSEPDSQQSDTSTTFLPPKSHDFR